MGTSLSVCRAEFFAPGSSCLVQPQMQPNLWMQKRPGWQSFSGSKMEPTPSASSSPSLFWIEMWGKHWQRAPSQYRESQNVNPVCREEMWGLRPLAEQLGASPGLLCFGRELYSPQILTEDLLNERSPSFSDHGPYQEKALSTYSPVNIYKLHIYTSEIIGLVCKE